MRTPELTFVAWRAKAPRVRRRKAVEGIVDGFALTRSWNVPFVAMQKEMR